MFKNVVRLPYSSAGYAGPFEKAPVDVSMLGSSLDPLIVETASKVPVIVG
jgi:hypothetical protein